MAKQKATHSVRTKSKSFFDKHTNLIWLLPLLFTVIALVMFVHTIKEKSRIAEMETSRVSMTQMYTNPLKTFNIEYPENWTIKESHERSNREIDDPEEINTATLTGKEGEIVLQWGPMGFGGGCDEENSHEFTMKNKTMTICHGEQEDGKAYWSGIGDERHLETPMSARATANPPLQQNKKVIEQILSSLYFK